MIFSKGREKDILMEIDNNRYKRKKLLNICYNILFGYFISQIATFIAKWLGLTSMEYSRMVLYAIIVISGTLVFILAIFLKKTITIKFAKIIFILQSFLFLCMYTLWVYDLNEIRILGLFFALVALTFELTFTTLKQSLFLSMGTAIIQLSVTYYAIYHGNQAGSFSHELFFIGSFIPSFMGISIISWQVNKKHGVIREARNSLAMMNEKLTVANRELERVNKMMMIDMEIASYIQASIFPKEPPKNSGWDISFSFWPLTNVSGDFYDFYYRDERLAGMSIFDVSGHGVSSALITMFAKPMVFRLFDTMHGEPLGKVADSINESIFREITRTDNYITGIILRFKGNEIEYINAGHPELLIKRGQGGDVTAAEPGKHSHRGKPLGIFNSGNSYESVTFRIFRNDIIMLYSDCIIETPDKSGEKYGMDRLMKSLGDAPDGSSRDILNYITGKYHEAINRNDINDDLTIIIARKTE